MRLPNGFGSITKLAGKRRKPFMVRKNGQALSYHPTYIEAIEWLKNYNNTTLIEPVTTFDSVYREWLPLHSLDVGQSALESYRNAYRHIQAIVNMPIDTIEFHHLQQCIDTMRKNGLSYSSCKKVRSLLNMVFEYAIINKYCHASYSPYLKLGKDIKVKPHKPFTRQQINKLWQTDTYEANTVLILLYTGMRCGEMLALNRADVNIKSKYIIVRESKTEAGRNRIIPIHDRIYPIVASLRNSTSSRLIEKDGHGLNYSSYIPLFQRAMHAINTRHSTHDCRHTFASLLDAANANPTATRAILGHKNGDITTRVYTHKTIRELRKTINKLK